jgi:hypothetical protein
MEHGEAAQILRQVKMRYEAAEQALWISDYEAVDKQLSKLRDVLDDIYDRPAEIDPALDRPTSMGKLYMGSEGAAAIEADGK